MSDAAREEPGAPLIGVPRLRELLASAAPVTLLDVRWSLLGPPGRTAYDAGHLPGARFVDLDTELAAPPASDGSGGRHPLPDPDRFGAAMRAHGVSGQVPVVVHDQRDGTAAARAWWLLRYHGHPDVRVLDGGFDAWVRAGGPVVTTRPTTRGGDFVARPGALPVLDARGAARTAEHGLLLDARSPERYAGASEPVDAVAGHVPGAVSSPTSSLVREDGSMLDPVDLDRRFRELGAHAGGPVGAYCGSGVTAAHEVLALAVVGLEAALYAGSWSDWISDPERPVAVGR